MRTTIRIDDDLLTRLKNRARHENISLGRLVNRVLRAGLAAADRVEDTPAYLEQTFSMGEPQEDLNSALRLAGALYDEEALRKLMLRK
ncbi:MAG: hypothetical protein AAFN78_15815 [Pseudomonadota bacterium]